MDSPKKRRRKLGLSRTSNHGAKVTQLKRLPLNRSMENNNEEANSGTSHRKSLPNLHNRITTREEPSEGNACSNSLNESSGSADMFEDNSHHLETDKIASLPLHTASLSGDSNGRHIQRPMQNNGSLILQPLNPNSVDVDENLPSTQCAAAYILSSVVVYVEVRAGGDNRTRLVMRELRNLGATVVETITRKVTHIVFQNGKISTYKLAISKSIHMVSTQWIYECRNERRMVPEHLYPPHDLEYYKDPAKHKMIKRVKSFQPDYDMDQEQRMKRIRKRMKPRQAEPVMPKYKPIEDEYEMEYDFMRRRIDSKMEKHKSPGECGLIRGLLTIAGPIDPTYYDYIQRPVSPTSSEDDMIPVPLAVKLMRMIQSPQPSPLKKLQSAPPVNPTSDEDDIEAHMAALFRESSDLDTSDIIPQKTSTQEASPEKAFQTTTPACFTADSGDNAGQPPAKFRKMETAKLPSLEVTTVALDNLPTTPGPTASQRAVRKLFNGPREDDSPKLILPSCSDTESSQSMSRNTKLTHSKKRKRTPKTPLAVDMEITTCVGNAILDDPSSLRTKSARKSERIKSRRSSIFFASPKQIEKTKSVCETQSNVAGLPTIVCTSLTTEEVDVIKQVVKDLGGFEVEDTVTRKTTHVVSMNKCNRRTVNILRGIARGCWIVKKMWVLRSLEAGRWIAEDEFEWTDFSPAVQLCRFERLAFSPYYRPNFFKDCGPIFVSKTAKPARKDLYELVVLCGGKATYSPKTAKVVVGDGGNSKTAAHVTVQWILDTIQAAALKPTAEYTLQA